jgi:hypothetical protein
MLPLSIIWAGLGRTPVVQDNKFIERNPACTLSPDNAACGPLWPVHRTVPVLAVTIEYNASVKKE